MKEKGPGRRFVSVILQTGIAAHLPLEGTPSSNSTNFMVQIIARNCMLKCEGSTSSLVFPEFAWKGFSWCTMIYRCQESSGGQPQLGWNHWTLGVTPWARMAMPRARLELGVFLRLIFQNTSRYMKAKVKSLASSRIFHLTKWCKATCNICSLAAWCMGANYLGWVASMKISV